MKNYLYFLVFIFNIIVSFYLATDAKSFSSVIQFYLLYIGTAIFFSMDWFLTKPRYDSTKLIDSPDSIKSYYNIMTNYGDRLMALAIIAVTNIIIFGVAIPDSVIQLIEGDFGTPLILILISIFLVPAILLKLFIEPYAKKSEPIIYQRMKESILQDKIIIPEEILPYIKPRTRQERKIEYTQPEAGLSLQAYPNTDQKTENLDSEDNIVTISQDIIEDPREALEQAHKTFILSVFPELELYFDRKPVSLQNAFFYEIFKKIIKNEPECRSKLGI